jgi:hypothetical protein
MLISETSGTQFTEKIIDITDFFLTYSFESLMDTVSSNQQKQYNHLCPNNPENIETGISGFLFFLLEAYNHTGHAAYLSKILEIVKALIPWCADNETGNYSLYTGRGGFVYFLIHLYHTTGDELLLEKAEELIQPAAGEYLGSVYTTDYLYNGRSGTLLVLLELFLCTQAAFCKQALSAYVQKIINNAILSEQGISWKAAAEVNLKNSCGFANGASGVRYVLQKVFAVFPQPGIEYLLDNANRYINACFDNCVDGKMNYEKEINCKEVLEAYMERYSREDAALYMPETDHGWAAGKAGVLISQSSADGATFAPQIDNSSSLNIFQGLAGIGLCLLENRESAENRIVLKQIAAILTAADSAFTLDGGLFFGDAGKAYFLLKYFFGSNEAGCIVKPGSKSYNQHHEEFAFQTISDVRKKLISRYYYRTISLMELLRPAALNNYMGAGLQKTGEPEISLFEDFMLMELYFAKRESSYAVIEDVFNLENKKYLVAKNEKRTGLQIYLDQISHQEAVIQQLNKPDEWLMERFIVISDKVNTASSKWDWELKNDFDIVQAVYMQPRFYEYLFVASNHDGITEYALKLDAIVLHKFDIPKKLGEGLQEIKEIFKTLPTFSFHGLSLKDETGSVDIGDFIKRIDFLALHKIKQYLYEGILDIVQDEK